VPEQKTYSEVEDKIDKETPSDKVTKKRRQIKIVFPACCFLD